VEHVWNMKQLSTKNDDYQRKVEEIKRKDEVFDITRRSEHLALSSGEHCNYDTLSLSLS